MFDPERIIVKNPPPDEKQFSERKTKKRLSLFRERQPLSFLYLFNVLRYCRTAALSSGFTFAPFLIIRSRVLSHSAAFLFASFTFLIL
ncbi:MAG: hypothetical protein CVU70_01430 [Deltaproteobacteria bacterium HGW-Deltaproteobacteria-5]|nr:MAG: hypothetical protein CVU70_01430 [Deltaproteobacteria bacterium HGW-Deltaproteobacteria-5]